MSWAWLEEDWLGQHGREKRSGPAGRREEEQWWPKKRRWARKKRKRLFAFMICDLRNLRGNSKGFEMNSKLIERDFGTYLCTPNSNQDSTENQFKSQGTLLQSNLDLCNNLLTSSISLTQV
jgi:hypothetical protein